jgi:hypothetical protein
MKNKKLLKKLSKIPKKIHFFILAIIAVLFIFLFYFLIPNFFPTVSRVVSEEMATSTAPTTPSFVVTHVETPKPLKAIYMTACVVATPSFREKLKKIAETTEINSIMIDVKDYTGTITFHSENTLFKENIGVGCKVNDLKEFIGELHKSNIYVIARISTFQDKYLVSKRPDLAVKKSSDGTVWKDYKGVSWLDAGSKEVWNYITELGKESYSIGFDEINFDYIRFPSDGNMKDIAYPFSVGRVKADVIRDFSAHVSSVFKPLSIPISADVFGMVTTNTDDLNIGQILENFLPYFDYIAPMVYASHYPPTFLGYKKPAEYPYEVVKYSMTTAVERAIAASSTVNKLRPWLQDFNLGADYTAAMVRKQIQATYDSGLDSFMLWDAGNTYTVDALLPKDTSTNTKKI